MKKYIDGSVAYIRNPDHTNHETGERTFRRHLTLRTGIRCLAGKTICFSESERIHDIVIGLFISAYEFGLVI
ncbi:MAG: hypothetical protein B6245_20785 [Desulfobacteraceae bacterium 4572_88]|nr:MAG: hypothetical protein B6245_20785 [Desulfobacteraceae bacterium 4572_88]